MKIYTPSGIELDVSIDGNGDTTINSTSPPKTYYSDEEYLQGKYNDVFEILTTAKMAGIIGNQSHPLNTHSIKNEGQGANKQKVSNPTPVFTTYIYSSVYDITYLQNAAKQAELLDRDNGINNTRVIAVTEDFLNKSSLINPETDLIYEITKASSDTSSSLDSTTGVVGNTYTKMSGRDFQNKKFIGGYIMGNALPPGMNKDRYSPTDLGIILDHERITHGFKILVRDLFSTGNDIDERLQNSILSELFGADYSDDNYNGIEKPIAEPGDFMGNEKYTALRDSEKYSEQSIET